MGDNARFLIIDGFSVHWNGIILMLALIAGAALVYFLRKFQKGSTDNLLICIIASLVGAFVGARIYYYWNAVELFRSFSEILSFSNGGYAVYGALIGAVVCIIICALVLKEPAGELLDVMAPGMALAIGIGRWGAAFTGENTGPAVERLQKFPFAVFNETEGTWMSGFFFYQSLIALFICAAVSTVFLRRYKTAEIRSRACDVFLLFILLYSLPQGVFELFRIDPLYFHPIFINKLKTVPISLAVSAVLSAAALSVMILRRMSLYGITIATSWPVAACAAGYFLYFNVTMRLELGGEELEKKLVYLGCAILLVTGFILYSLMIKDSTADESSPRSDRKSTPQPGNRQKANPYF